MNYSISNPINLKLTILLLLMVTGLMGQMYIPADPYNLIFLEKQSFSNIDSAISTQIRPVFYPFNKRNKLFLKARTEFFYNSDAPNLENMSDRWPGKGLGYFGSIHAEYRLQLFTITAEPFYFINQNKEFVEARRLEKFSYLNDNRPHLDKPYISYGIREFQAYLHHKGIGCGLSNANMWFGPGLHTSPTMTNNTIGFPHVFVGTVEEKRLTKWSINSRYVFSSLKQNKEYDTYYTAGVFSASYDSDPKISIGLVREAITGGLSKNDSIKWQAAALAIFSGLLIPLDNEEFRNTWSHDDHAGSIFVSLIFKQTKLMVFFEFAKTQSPSVLRTLLVYPDHGIATNFGFRKYGLFGEDKLILAGEYFQNFNSRSSHRIIKGSGDWYIREQYNFNSYEGRRWAAHSGADSDDFLLMAGWVGKKFSILPSVNYERHRVVRQPSEIDIDAIEGFVNKLPETKLEFRLDLRYKYNSYKFNLYYERELTLNLAHSNNSRSGNVLWFGIEKDLNLFSNW